MGCLDSSVGSVPLPCRFESSDASKIIEVVSQDFSMSGSSNFRQGGGGGQVNLTKKSFF